jgi:hypothetical protein
MEELVVENQATRNFVKLFFEKTTLVLRVSQKLRTLSESCCESSKFEMKAQLAKKSS